MENIKLTKEYSLNSDILMEGCRAYQKKFVYPRSYILIVVFLALAANFVYGAVKAPDNYLAYLLIMVCLALAFREWYNPRRLRRSIIEGFSESSGTVYRLEIGEDKLRISTVYEENGDEPSDSGEEYEAEAPEATVLPVDDRLAIIEEERLFLIIQEKSVYYIVPKSGFSEEELEIVRSVMIKE